MLRWCGNEATADAASAFPRPIIASHASAVKTPTVEGTPGPA